MLKASDDPGVGVAFTIEMPDRSKMITCPHRARILRFGWSMAMLFMVGLHAQEPAQIEEIIPPPPPSPPEPVERLEQRGSSQWHVLRVDGREYVRFEDVHQFYRFDRMDLIGDEVILESPKISLRFLAGMHQAQFKGYKCFLSFPPLRHKERIYLSRVDLALLVDPTIRPSSLAMDSGVKPSILLNVAAKNKLAVEVARHVKSGLEAFGMQGLTELPEDPTTVSILGRIHLTEHTDDEELQTRTLAPYGTPKHKEAEVHEGEEAAPGNAQDRLNVALGMALHATLMETVQGILDGGLCRDRTTFLQEATEPAVSISLPAESTASAEMLGAAIVGGLRQFRKALDRER